MHTEEEPGRQETGRDHRDDTADVAVESVLESAPRTARPPSRQGKKSVTAYVDRAAHKQLRSLGLDLDKSNQDMLVEAINDYFERHGLDRLA